MFNNIIIFDLNGIDVFQNLVLIYFTTYMYADMFNLFMGSRQLNYNKEDWTGGSDHLVVVGGIAYLKDPDSYAGWSFYTPGMLSQVRQVEG